MQKSHFIINIAHQHTTAVDILIKHFYINNWNSTNKYLEAEDYLSHMIVVNSFLS